MGNGKDQWEVSRTPPLEVDDVCLAVLDHVGPVPDIQELAVGLFDQPDRRVSQFAHHRIGADRLPVVHCLQPHRRRMYA